jgi:dolichol-phosphate mannosyltransferase
LSATADPDLSVILPSYEEAANLRWLLPEIQAQLKNLKISNEILVVDAERPRDETPDLCRTHGVVYLPRQGGSLYSHALKTGINRSRGGWVLSMDADGSHPPKFLPHLWAARKRADLVIASRYVRGGGTENPALLIFLSYLVNLTFRLLLGFSCHDVSNSFRLYRADALRALSLECRNFDILEEILLKLQLADPKFVLTEVPFTFETRKEGKTKRDLWAFALGYVATLWRLHRLKRAALGKHP